MQALLPRPIKTGDCQNVRFPPAVQDGCGYMVVVNTYTEEPISILIKEGIQIRGVERK